MPNIFDQFDAASEVKDLATSFGVGSNQLLKSVGDVYGLATGDMDNVVSRQGRENIDYLQRGKSEKLRQAEARRKTAVDAEEGVVNQALKYAKETFTDPRLLLSGTAEAVPSLVGAGGIGAGARVAAGRVLGKKGAETAAKIGVGTAVAAGSGQQGGSVGAEQYSEVADILKKMPDEQAMEVPEIARLMSENGYSLEKAKNALTLNLARSTGALAAIASAATQMVPGGRTIESALVGGAGKKAAGGTLARRGIGAAMGALGEGVQEGAEEGSGAVAKNVLARAVEPEREITKGVGEAMGAGFSGAALLGAAAGAASRPSRPVPVGETTAGKSGEPQASDATNNIPVLESTTDLPSISLRDIENMSPEEFAAAIDVRDAASRGGKPRPEDVTSLENVRPSPVQESDTTIIPVQEALDEWRNQNQDVELNVTVVNDPNMRNTRNYGIRGYFDPNTGEVVINSAFTKPFEVESVVNHEWSHHTLASDEGRAALAEFATRDIPAEELTDLAKRYPNADNLTLVEEWIARNQEKSPGVFARIVAKIREWLNGKLGINMTNEEAARVMLRTLRERGAPVAEEGGEMRQSTTDQPVDTASENLTKTPNEPTSVQQEEPRPARALPKSRFYVSSDERGGDFAGAIAEAARVHTKGAAVEVKSPEFYADPENHLYFSEDGRAGAVVKPDGDLVSVFKHPESTAKMRDILTDASQEATKLDGFDIDGFLPNYYSRFGFKPVARVTFNDEFAPPKWDFAENGRPDNVFMVRDPENKLGLPKYDAYSEVRDSVPLVSYDEALKLQQEAVDAVASEKPKGAEPERSSVLAKQPIRESVTDKPVGEMALEEAKNLTFKNQSEVSKYLGDLLKKEFPNGLDGRSPEDRANLAKMFDRELSLALTIPENADAIGWYNREMQKVFEVLRSPELDFKLDDPTNRGIFNAILAVTSNGQKVVPQFLKTAQLYGKWLKTGKIPPVGKWGGERNSAIKGHLKFLNQLIEAVGPEQTVGFLTSEQSLGDHLTNLYGMVAEAQNLPAEASVADQKAAVKKYLKTTMPSGELVDYNTVGAAVLGPKLGGGFFANLYGKFDRLTMDRWFMRTFHRLTGRLGLQRTDTIAGVLQEARSEAADVLPEDVSDEEILQEINTTGKQAFKEYKNIKKRLEENPDDTEALAQDLMRRLYNRYTKARSGLFDAPDNGGHRNFIRDVVNDVQKMRAERGEEHIDTSDIQAILWYLEKDIWNQLRKKTEVDETAGADAQADEDDGDTEDTAGRVSYSDGARELYRQKTGREFQFQNESAKNQVLRRE